MIKLQGKRNSATVYADQIDPPTKTQIASLLRESAYAEEKIVIMPDTHAGRLVAVGTTMTVGRKLNPSLVGVDIGCGVEVVLVEDRTVDLQALDGFIHREIPAGAKIHAAPVADFDLSPLRASGRIDRDRALRSLGTLGGGNHFIELDRREDGSLMLVIHSGSRGLGSDVAETYRSLAVRNERKKAGRRAKELDREGSEYDRKALRRENTRRMEDVKRDTALLEGAALDDYLCDLALVTAFAEHNRRTIADRICDAMGFTVRERFTSVHNYVDTAHGILRKGAISARQGERVVIPLNMRDGVALGVGLGNPDWNFSAPHGAGRICSRSDARHAYTVEEYKAAMEGIYTTTAELGSLDECPMAYKPPHRILDLITETVRVDEIAKPIYNFKSC